MPKSRRKIPHPPGSSPEPGAFAKESAKTGASASSLQDVPGERVAKALARAGVASRREAERLIAEGRISVNGFVLESPAIKIGPKDDLRFDGARVRGPEPTRLWRYHKPPGLVTTHRDPEGRATVFENLPANLPRVISVGRLDLNSEGLLLLTNDGELSRFLELPSTQWTRLYRARAFGRIQQIELDRLMSGITVDGFRYGPIEAVLESRPGQDARADYSVHANNWIKVSIREGKNREIRRVLEAIGLRVSRLIRIAYGPFQLGHLQPGLVEEIPRRVLKEQLGANALKFAL